MRQVVFRVRRAAFRPGKWDLRARVRAASCAGPSFRYVEGHMIFSVRVPEGWPPARLPQKALRPGGRDGVRHSRARQVIRIPGRALPASRGACPPFC